jgi:hypothetical protein
MSPQDDEKTFDLKKQELVGDVRVDLEGLVFQSQGNWVAFPIAHRRPKRFVHPCLSDIVKSHPNVLSTEEP